MKNILKKSFCTIMAVASVFCMASCADANATSKTTMDPSTAVSGDSGGCGGEKDTFKSEEIEYLTFEEMCANADYIVVANYVDAIMYSDTYARFTYKIKESLYGDLYYDDLSGVIDICVKAEEDKNYMVDINGREQCFWEDSLNHGYVIEDVVLFLTLEENMEGFSSPQYTWRGAPIVNLRDLSKSEMYNESIAEHMTGLDITKATSEEVLTYIKSLIANKKAD